MKPVLYIAMTAQKLPLHWTLKKLVYWHTQFNKESRKKILTYTENFLKFHNLHEAEQNKTEEKNYLL